MATLPLLKAFNALFKNIKQLKKKECQTEAAAFAYLCTDKTGLASGEETDRQEKAGILRSVVCFRAMLAPGAWADSLAAEMDSVPAGQQEALFIKALHRMRGRAALMGNHMSELIRVTVQLPELPGTGERDIAQETEFARLSHRKGSLRSMLSQQAAVGRRNHQQHLAMNNGQLTAVATARLSTRERAAAVVNGKAPNDNPYDAYKGPNKPKVDDQEDWESCTRGHWVHTFKSALAGTPSGLTEQAVGGREGGPGDESMIEASLTLTLTLTLLGR